MLGYAVQWYIGYFDSDCQIDIRAMRIRIVHLPFPLQRIVYPFGKLESQLFITSEKSS